LKVVALAGGTGSARLVRGLSSLGVDLSVIANVGDNVWMHGLYVCPDIDTAMYTLAGISDSRNGWGLEGDTFYMLRQLSRLGEATWFALGDMDTAIHIARTRMLHEGEVLTSITDKLCKAFKISQKVLPLTDNPIETRIFTNRGSLHLQEFWVRDRGLPKVTSVKHIGASQAHFTKDVCKAIENADRIVVCPANPVTSIGPMLAVPGFTRLLRKTKARITALSPMIGQAAYSGPAAKLMESMGMVPSSVGVAEKYAQFADSMIIDRRDKEEANEIEELGVKCAISDTLIVDSAAEVRLSKELLQA